MLVRNNHFWSHWNTKKNTKNFQRQICCLLSLKFQDMVDT